MSLLFGKLFKKRPYLFGRRIPPLPPSVPLPTLPKGIKTLHRVEKTPVPRDSYEEIHPVHRDDDDDLVKTIVAVSAIMSSSEESIFASKQEDPSPFEGGSSGGGGAERSWEPDPSPMSDTTSISND
jgi:hypothetical protein